MGSQYFFRLKNYVCNLNKLLQLSGFSAGVGGSRCRISPDICDFGLYLRAAGTWYPWDFSKDFASHAVWFRSEVGGGWRDLKCQEPPELCLYLSAFPPAKWAARDYVLQYYETLGANALRTNHKLI